MLTVKLVVRLCAYCNRLRSGGTAFLNLVPGITVKTVR